ncbi:MMPL family transporter [Geodermatophilus sp. DSM 44513]|uniref:MMPL family transporter n=1 Tax=Geodermatophilus sp. DSM 44513 TaxID=1528104 RepID=UPI001289CFD2|nr:MMPL family transporter [Geodermatophilus sp. DSM 44513]WNV75758.1 MMPL family transporter [Geodermatophilus sp. DSM 44513]
MDRLSALVTRRRRAWAVLVLYLAAAAAVLLAPAPDQVAPPSSSGLPDDYQSAQAERLQAQLPQTGVEPVLAVVSRSDGGALSPADLAAAQEAAAAGAGAAGSTVAGPPDVSPDGAVAVLVVPLDTTGGDEAVADRVAALREAVGADLPGGLTVQVTGGPAFGADLLRVFEGADTTLLLVTAAVVAVLLLVTYRSPVLWIVPLAVVATAEQATLALLDQVLPRLGLAYDGSTVGITSVLVFGAATDYALLLIARYREQLRVTADRFAAMRTAVARTAEAILASGGTVVLACLTLLLATREGSRALGAAAALGVAVAVVAGLVVLPCALVLCGRGLFWPLVPRVGSRGTEGRVWGRLGEGVARAPRLVAALGIAVLALLSVGGLGLQTGLSQVEQLRAEPESVLGARTLAGAFPAGSAEPVAVLTTTAAAPAVADAAAGVEGVASAAVGLGGPEVTQVDVVLDAEPGSAASETAVRELREAVAAVPDAGAAVGGSEATAVDLADAEARDRLVVIPLVLVLVAAVLVALLRSLVAPLLLVLTVVASYAASVGASWLLFTTVWDFPALDEGVLLLSFLFLVALGVDYNIFLVTRAREEAARLGTRAGVLTALRVTGGVITSAGILLAAVFAVLGVLPLVTLTQIGVIVCVGVLLDTLLVRTVIVPALAFWLGDRFWWPGRPQAPAPEPPHGGTPHREGAAALVPTP